jgi:hypothetical protein
MTDFADLTPSLIFEFRMRIQVGTPVDQGARDGWRYREIPILGGTIEGARMRGEVLGGGADAQSIRLSDGFARIDARYGLRHADGTEIAICNIGIRRGPPQVMARLAAGESVDPALYYFRAAPTFEVAQGPHQWLSEHLFVCLGKRWPDAVELDIYRVT